MHTKTVRQISIYLTVYLRTFSLFLPTFTHRYTALSQKRSNFCLSKVTSFFIQAIGLVYHHRALRGVYHRRKAYIIMRQHAA